MMELLPEYIVRVRIPFFSEIYRCKSIQWVMIRTSHENPVEVIVQRSDMSTSNWGSKGRRKLKYVVILGGVIIHLVSTPYAWKSWKMQFAKSTPLLHFITMTSQWARWRLKSPASGLFTEPFIQAQIKENIKAPRHWPLCGEFTGDRWIPRTNGQ